MTRSAKRVLVTGGASGLGASLVGEFLKRGDRVLVTDVAESYVPPEGADYLRLNVTSDADWGAARNWVESNWGGLDVLVNNAGIATGGRIDVVSLDEWRGVIDVNLLSVVRGCRTFVPLMKQQADAGQSGAHIVNTASLAGLVHPPAMASYTAVKAGVVAISETLSYELSPWDIAVSAICPGFFRTNLASSLAGSDAAVDKVAARLIVKSPLTAPQVAAEVMKGIDARRMVIQPDAPGRKAAWTKKFARPLYDRDQRRFAARIKAITESETKRKA